MVVVVRVAVIFGVVGIVVATHELHLTGHFFSTKSLVRALAHKDFFVPAHFGGSSLPLQWVALENGAVCSGTRVTSVETAGATVGFVVVATATMAATGAVVVVASILVGLVVVTVVVVVVGSFKILNFGDLHSSISSQERPSPDQPVLQWHV